MSDMPQPAKQRKYVAVVAGFRPDGTIVPLRVVWDDITYTVDRVLSRRYTPDPDTGGVGWKFRVLIEGREHVLWFMRDTDISNVSRWYEVIAIEK